MVTVESLQDDLPMVFIPNYDTGSNCILLPVPAARKKSCAVVFRNWGGGGKSIKKCAQ